MNTSNLIHNPHGLTLVEIMVVLVLSTLLMSAAFMSFQAQNRSGRSQERVVAMQQDLRVVADIIEKDLRNAGCVADTTCALPRIDCLLASTSGLQCIGLQMDLDADGTNEHVIYTRDGSNNLLRNGDFLVGNVTSFGVVYRDPDNNTVALNGASNASYGAGNTLDETGVDNACVVVYNLTVRSSQIDPDTGTFLTRSLTKRVQLRNYEEP